MATTSTLNAIDLMKPANAGESTRLLLNVPHVPSSITLRPSVVCDTSLVLVEHTNMIRIGKGRCTQHLNLSVNHSVVEQLTLEIDKC